MLEKKTMKKIILLLVAAVCLGQAAQAQRHIEFRWRGAYFVGNITYATNSLTTTENRGFRDTVSGFMPMVVGGYQFRKEAGVGVGFAFLKDPNGAFTQMPAFVELRSHFMRSQLTPYSVLQLGYTLPLGSSAKGGTRTKIDEGGLYLGIGFGGRYAFSRGLALGAELGYKMLQSRSVLRKQPNNTSMLTDPVVLHMLTFGLSLYFSNL